MSGAAPGLACLLALVALGGCERKAPGPAECHAAALRLLGVTEQQRMRSRRILLAVDELTVECLTTPFDREFTRCVEERGGRVCLHELRSRMRAARERAVDAP